jgi:twitching motility protein PilT
MNQVFVNILIGAVKYKVSDVHLHVGTCPGFRMKGEVMDVKLPPISETDMLDICSSLLKSSGSSLTVQNLKDYDGSYEMKGVARFRFNIFRQRGQLGIILRVIPALVPTIDQLGLPSVLKDIAGMHRGLVLVTGATGSGKSSTLAAMIDYINSTWPMHILTIEDPVEFVHQRKKCRFTQREVGPDTDTYAGALKSALRQDPDIILVGEMRDAETIGIALKAAETGHMVFSTVHTTDAIKTIGRLIAVFPPEEQRMIRMRLAENITATISQRLVKRADGKGMIAAQEIMVANTGIRECIADPNQTGMLNDFISKSNDANGGGGQTFEQHLVKLYYDGVINLDEAMEAASNPGDLERNLTYAASENNNGRRPQMDLSGIQLETDEDRTKNAEASKGEKVIEAPADEEIEMDEKKSA